MAQRIVSATRLIHAPAEDIFNLLADPRQHSRIDGSGSVLEPRSAPDRLFLGAKFSMDMRLGVSYFTTNKVVEFEENRVIAWHHVAMFVWRYQLEPVEGGTQVTESFDYSKPWGLSIMPFGVPEKNRVSMEKTLERIEDLLTAPNETEGA